MRASYQKEKGESTYNIMYVPYISYALLQAVRLPGLPDLWMAGCPCSAERELPESSPVPLSPGNIRDCAVIKICTTLVLEMKGDKKLRKVIQKVMSKVKT